MPASSAELDDDVAVAAAHGPLLIGLVSPRQDEPARVGADGVDVGGLDEHELTAIGAFALASERERAGETRGGLSKNLVLTEPR